MIYLKELNTNDSQKEYDFFKELPSLNGFENPYRTITYDEFVNIIIPKRLAYAQGINLLPGHVPDTYFFLWDDDIIVGLFKVRHYLNDFLHNGSGHIGYSVHPKYWRKSYATQGLKMAIDKLVKLPDFKENEIFLSCNIDNPASLKVMLNNNGYIHHQDDKEYYVRIKVK